MYMYTMGEGCIFDVHVYMYDKIYLEDDIMLYIINTCMPIIEIKDNLWLFLLCGFNRDV